MTTTSQYFVGIDPGKSGGFVILTDKGAIHDALPMPEKQVLHKLSAWAALNKSVHVAIENVQPDRGWAIRSAWTFAKHIGQLELLFPQATLVNPLTWQAMMTKGHPSKDPKQRALAAAKIYWPKMDWLATPRCKTPHDGMVDAALIAQFLRLSARTH